MGYNDGLLGLRGCAGEAFRNVLSFLKGSLGAKVEGIRNTQWKMFKY